MLMLKGGIVKENYVRLLELASGQGGYFTARQACEVGFEQSTHGYHVKKGHWERLQGEAEAVRGIYRLSALAPGPSDALFAAALWTTSRGGEVVGVVSHESALHLYDLSDLIPARMHLTVPAAFRRRSDAPEGVVLHRAPDMLDLDVWDWEGLRVTRPYQTLRDLIKEGRVSLEHVERGYKEGRAKGLITEREAEALSGLSESEKDMVLKWEKERRDVR